MDDTQKQALLSALRSLLLVAGAGLVASGKLSAEDLATYVGAIVIILPFAWGVWDKYRSARRSALVTAVAVNDAVQRQAPISEPIQPAEQKAIAAAARAVVQQLPEAQITAALNNSQLSRNP